MSIQVSFTPLQPKMVDPAASVSFTEAAADRIKALIEEQNNPELKLRVYVTGGGCSGFQYGFDFDDKMTENDVKIEKNGVIMLVDKMSMQYVKDAEIDFLDSLEGSRFVVNNPNAKSTCGCGTSFSV